MRYLFHVILITSIGYSQTIAKQVIGSAGKTQINSNLKVSWTIGEPVVGLMSAGGNQLSNGYYPAMNIKTLKNEDNFVDLQVKVYPNPTSQLLCVSHPELNSFAIQITDLNGKQIYAGKISKDHPLDMSYYTQGMYLVTIENNKTKTKNTYKIIKK